MTKALDFYELVAARLSVEAEMSPKWLRDRHWPSVGASREAALRRWIAEYLPGTMLCGSGFIMNDRHELSRQCDLLVYDTRDQPPLYVDEHFVVIMPETAKLVIEVKSNLSDAVTFRAAVDNIRSVKLMDPMIPAGVCALVSAQTTRFKKWLEDLPDEIQPEHLFDQLFSFNGVRLTRVAEESRLPDQRIGDIEYLPPNVTSGQALLLFLDWILSACSEAGGRYLWNFVTQNEPYPTGTRLLNYGGDTS